MVMVFFGIFLKQNMDVDFKCYYQKLISMWGNTCQKFWLAFAYVYICQKIMLYMKIVFSVYLLIKLWKWRKYKSIPH